VDLRRFVRDQQPARFAPGELIFERGEPGDVMYVASGRVALDHGGPEPVLVGPGEAFGEMALIDQAPRSATATAATDTALYEITEALFLLLVQDTPQFALEIMRALSLRLRQANADDTD
jgi:CRP/FNR family transcriptional regulator, cyclic AMP receptor protein